MCAALAESPTITQHIGHLVESLTPADTGWRVQGRNQCEQTWSYEAEVVVVCTAYQVKSFAPWACLPLTPVRGQITALSPTPHSENLRTIICAGGYLVPCIEGTHMVGATHGFKDESIDLRASDHEENLSRLAEMSADLARVTDSDSFDVRQLGGRASVRASVPGAMPLVGELSPGLYTSLGHGTRGIITAGLSGELIAAASCGQLLPLPSAVINALAPAGRLKRENPLSG